MKIKMLQSSRTIAGEFFARNQVYDVPAARAGEYVKAHLASRVAETAPEKRTKAIHKPNETR